MLFYDPNKTTPVAPEKVPVTQPFAAPQPAKAFVPPAPTNQEWTAESLFQGKAAAVFVPPPLGTSAPQVAPLALVDTSGARAPAQVQTQSAFTPAASSPTPQAQASTLASSAGLLSGATPTTSKLRRVHPTVLSGGNVGLVPVEDVTTHSSQVERLVPGQRVEVVSYPTGEFICTLDVGFPVGNRGHVSSKDELAFSEMIRDGEWRNTSRSGRKIHYVAAADPRSPHFNPDLRPRLGTISIDPASVSNYEPPRFLKRPQRPAGT